MSAGEDGGGISETTNGIAATVRYPDGSRAAGATVRLRHSEYLAGDFDPSPGMFRNTVTDSKGCFSIDSLDSGSYFVEISDTGSNTVLCKAQIDNNERIDTSGLVLVPAAVLTGNITARSAALAAIRIRVYGLERSNTANTSGHYRLTVPPDHSYRLRFSEDSGAVDTDIDSVGAGVTETADFDLYRLDSLAVRAVLDSLGLIDVTWDSIIGTHGTRIRTLNLSNQNITNLHPSIATLTMIVNLSLDSNPLARLPSYIAAMSALRGLTLVNTGLSSLPWSMNEMNLGWLDISKNTFTEVPPVVWSIRSLLNLDIASNDIHVLPDSIGNLEMLNRLGMNNNRIAALPGRIGRCTALRELYAYDNALDSLPSSIGQLTELQNLNIERNLMTTLPPAIGSCTALIHLRLAGCPISSLPPGITSLENVTDLSVWGCSLCAADPVVDPWIEGILGAGWRTRHPQHCSE
jgi:hypothetical protein